MNYLDLIPKWAIAAALAVFALMFTGQNIKTRNLTLELSHANTNIAQLKASISEGNERASAQAAKFEAAARAAEQDRTKREKTLVADADSARRALAGLRESVSKANSSYGLRAGKTTIAPSLDPADTVSELLVSCSERYIGVAAEADRWVNEVTTLRQAWPKP